ncbi:hypothetical protein JOC78_002918 [Bacillus ectoiniformans]|nr:hypothetical protein [Bacillus ectoiniformans]
MSHEKKLKVGLLIIAIAHIFSLAFLEPDYIMNSFFFFLSLFHFISAGYKLKSNNKVEFFGNISLGVILFGFFWIRLN